MIKVPDNIQELIPYKAGKPIQEIRRELNLTKIAKLSEEKLPFGSASR